MRNIFLACVATAALAACTTSGGSFHPHLDGGNNNPDGFSGNCTGTGETSCNGVCTNTQFDPNNCGNCQNVCSGGQACVNGQCSSNNNCTGTGAMMCNGVCTNVLSDPNNCGFCNNSCNGQSCNNGECATSTCTNGQPMCGGTCCQTGQSCVNNICQTTTQMTGCNGWIQCVGNCTTQQCVMTCTSNTTSQGQQLAQSLLTCLNGACPSGTGQVCDPNATDGGTACNNCYSAAQMSGGACYSQLQACLSNTP